MREPRLSRAALVFAFASILATNAAAQAPRRPVAPPTTTPALDDALPAPTTVPPPPPIDDPQLAPPPEAPRVLRSWDEALTLVRAQSPDYRTTYDNVLRAEAQSRVALAGILPSASLQASLTHQLFTAQVPLTGTTPETYPQQNVWGVGGTLLWPVGNPRAYYAIGTAKENARAFELDLAEKRRTIAQAIVSAMLTTLASVRVAELNRVGLRSSLERLALAHTKTTFGSGTALDVDRASQDVAAARALVITGDEALRQSREALGVALGSRVPIAAPGDLDLRSLETTVAATCHLDDDLERRSDIAAARRRVVVADRAINDVWLQFVPSFAIQSQLAWASQVLYPPETMMNVQGVLTVPLWDGGARYGLLRDARAAADQAKEALIATRLQALVNVAQSQRAVTVAAASRDVAQQQRDLAFRIDQRTREGYLHGLGTSLDLVISAQALRQADINLVLLQFEASQARVLAILSNAECVY